MCRRVADALQLLFRQQAGLDVVKSHLARDGFRRAFAVAREHCEVGDFQVLEIVNRPAGAFANTIAKEEVAHQDAVVGHQHRCRAVAIGFLQQRFQAGDIMFREEAGVSREDGAPGNLCHHAAARNDARFVRLRDGNAAMPRFFQNGARQHVLRPILRRGGQRQNVGFASP